MARAEGKNPATESSAVGYNVAAFCALRGAFMTAAYHPGAEPVPGYRLVKIIGKGRHSQLWRAVVGGGMEVALKIIGMYGAPLLGVLRALQNLTRFRHPHIVPLHGFWLKDVQGRLFDQAIRERTSLVVDELFLAQSLTDMSLQDRYRECLAAGEPGIPAEELVGYIEDAARALDHLNLVRDQHPLHTPVPHGEILPRNLLLMGGSALISEFGLNRIVDELDTARSPWHDLIFAAPEILETLKPGATSDQYSLGLSYAYLRTGSMPFAPSEPTQLILDVLQGSPNLERLEPAERNVIRRATSKNPCDRYPSCGEMARDLRRALMAPTHIRVAPPRLEPKSELIPGYVLLECLAREGHGELWEARGPRGDLVALRVVRDLDRPGGWGKPALVALQLLRQLAHPNLVELRGVWLQDRHGNEIPYELLGKNGAPLPASLVLIAPRSEKHLGERLDEALAAGQTGLPPGEILGYLKQTAAILDFLAEPKHVWHDEKVSLVHRDVRPESLWLHQGCVRLDHSLLLKSIPGDAGSAMILQEEVGYSLPYVAPEVLRSRVTRWSDQYSLALTYCSLRTGRLPVDPNETPYQTMLRRQAGQLDLSALPEPEHAILNRATAVQPDKRYPTCREFIHALEKLFAPPASITNVAKASGITTPSTMARITTPARGGLLFDDQSDAIAPLLDSHVTRQTIVPGGKPLPDYTLVKKLGAGGYGEVWQAEGPGGIPVALKFIRTRSDSALHDPSPVSGPEIRALLLMRRIRHPHLLGMSGTWQTKNYLVIAMELADGTLLDRLEAAKAKGQPGLPVDELLSAMRDAAEGIDFLNEPRHDLGGDHLQGIQHRDIKPRNLLLVGDRVKVADFGIAKLMSDSMASHSGNFTAAYSPPEFFNRQTFQQSDQYSLAVSYCELRGGRLPFTGTAAQIITGHMSRPPDLSMLSPQERSVVRQALAKDAAERWPNCRSFVQALAACLGASTSRR
jgi:serine/threonine protein kinase